MFRAMEEWRIGGTVQTVGLWAGRERVSGCTFQHTHMWRGAVGAGGAYPAFLQNYTQLQRVLGSFRREEASQRKAEVWCPKATSGVWLQRTPQPSSLAAPRTIPAR